MDEKVLKLLERALAENLSDERVSYIMGVNGYDQGAIDAALGELKKKRPSQAQPSERAGVPAASTASPSVGAPRVTRERVPSALPLPEPTLAPNLRKAFGEVPAESKLPIPQKPGPQIEYIEDKKGNVVARDKRTGEVTYSDTPTLSPEARQQVEERVLSGQVQTAPVQEAAPEITVGDWFGDKWNGLIEGLEGFASNVRDEASLNGDAIADFIEESESSKPELYDLYQKNFEDAKSRGYSKEFARGIAANAAYTEFWRKDNKIENEIIPYIRQKGRDKAVENFGVQIDEKVQKELQDRFFSGAVRGLATSLPAMAASASTMGMSFFDMAYNGAEEQLAIQLAENPNLEMTKAEQETYKLTVAGIEGVLEKIGLGNTLKGNPMLKRALAGKVLTRLAGLGDDAGAEAFEKIVKEEARGLGGYVRKVAAGAMSEFETGALQQLSNDLINNYVTDSQGQHVFKTKTAKEIITDVLYAGAQEAVGGGIISGTIGAFQKPGLDMTKEEFDLGINFAQNIKTERVAEYLDKQVADGVITEDQAKSTLNRVQEFKDAAAKIPDELTDQAKYQIFQLIAQKQGLQKNVAGKDEAIQERVKQKVDAINQQIQEVYDSQTQQPVSGAVQAGEIIGQVFQQGTSSEKTSPSGVLQAPQAEVGNEFFQPVFTVDPAGRAVVSPEKDNSTVSSIGNIRPSAEISEEDAAEMNRIFNVAKNAVDKDSKVVVHNSLESLLNSNPAAAQMYVDGKGTAKAYWNNSTNEFHVLSRTAVEQYNAATGSDISYAKQYVHEVVHPIVNTLITEDAEVQGRLFNEIEEMAKSGNALAQRAVRFGKKYAESKQQNETVTEFFALVAQPDGLKNFDRSFKQKLKDFFNELFVRMGVDIKLESDQDLYTMARNIDLATRTGKSVVFPKTNAAYQARSIQASLDSTPAGSRLFNEPLEGVDEVIQDYMAKNNLPYRKGKKIFKLDKERAKQIGQAYDAMRNDPTDPQVKEAYDAMAKETIAQYEAILERGYKVEINNEEPYNNSQEMIEDLRNNKTMRIFSTEAGFGDTPITDDQRAENPLLRDSGYTDANGNVLLVNDVFRFVHDFFGHAERGNSFGPLGEENAWDAHSRMYTPLARKAMTSETRGQNSWVNFSGVNDEAFKLRDKARKLREEGRTDEAKQLVGQVYEMMRFAEQKIGLLPDAFITNDYDEIQFSTDQEAIIRDGKETVKFANSNPEFAVGTRAKVREITYAERVLEKNPMFMFTGVEKIRDASDVAFLFRHLESAVSENAFVTYHNPVNGDFRVQWLGTGGTTSATVDAKLIAAAYQNFAEDLGTSELVITLVHNHPSGTLRPSKADANMLSVLKEIFKGTGAEVGDGVIINLDSGKFVVFTDDNNYGSLPSQRVSAEQEVPYDTYSFNRQILYTPSSERTQVKSFNDVAAFLSKLKRGRHEKLGYFVMNNQGEITYSAIVDPNAPMKIKMRDVVADVGRYGEAIIIFGTDEAEVKSMRQQASNRLKPMNASVLDAVIIKDSKDFLDAESVQGGSLAVMAEDTIDFSLDDIPSVTIDSPNGIKNAISFASESAFSNKLDFKAALQDRFKSYEKEIKKQYGIKSFETYDNALANYLVDSYINETLIAIQSYPDALGWYDAKTKAAMATMSLIHPELETDVAAQAAFKIAVAVTSNGNKVFDNFKEADRQYKYYKKYGKFDSKYSIGTQSKGIKDTFKFTNMVLDKMSMENFATFLTSKFNAGDLKYIKGGKKTPLLSGFTVDTEVYGASIFGAKIGNGFFMNLYGQFDQLTMDRWFMRQYGRLTGTLLDIDPVKIKSGKVRLNQALRSLTASEKKTLASLIPDYKSFSVVELSHAINKASIKKDKRDMLSSTPALDELRKAGNSLSKNSSGEVEAPSGGNQRKFIVGVFNEVQRRLREDAGIEITIADLQAVNWYPEKALYQTFQEGREEADGATETSDNEQPDYESAAKRLAIENGITEEQIKNATRKQSGEPARESVARRAEQLTGDSYKPSVEQLSRAILNVKSGEEDGETYFSVDEGASNLRQTISRTINRFSPETRARVMNNPKAYYSKQSLNAIKDNLENMTDDELLENMTADGLNTISRTAAPGRSENDISVLAAIELINRKVEAGEDVSELLVDLSVLGTTVGRMLRHFAELKSSSPMGIVETIRAALKRADRVMTPTQEDRLTQIASRFIAAQQKAKELRDKIELVYSAEQEAELKKAMTELDKVTRELNLFTSIIIPKKTMDLLSTTIQGNLLTPISQVTNVGANLVQMVTSIPVKGFETLFSKITSAFTGKAPRSFSASVTALPYALKQAGVGVVEAFEIILKGGASSDKIVHTGFMPGAALLAALSDTKFASVVNATFGKEVIKGDVLSRLANGNIAAADRAKAVYEGLLGAAPEVMFRFLSLGDKPFFRFSEAMHLAQEANKLGLKGDARRNFLKYPSKKAMAAAQKAGQTVTFQQDNQAANLIFSIQKQSGKLPLVGPMIEFMMKVSLPYVKTPANIFSETMKFALPAYGVATATDKFFKKDFEGGSSDLAKAAVGQMIIAAANYLIANGIISAAFDDEDEGERAIAYLKQPPATLNKDALARLLAGEDPAYRDGDRIIRYDKLGIPGMVLGARANAVKRAGGKPDEDGYYVGEEGMFKPAQFIWDQMSMPLSTLQFMNEQSFLAGTNSLLNVLSGEASERDVEKWMENTFRALTAIPLPNTLSAVHRGQREYMPNIKSDNVLTKFKYVVMDRMFDVDGIPVKVDPLGAKIPQTPEGANSWYYNLVDFTKSAKTKDDMVWNELWSVYQATEEADVAPKFPTKLTYLPSETPEGIKIKGWNAKVEEEWRREMQRIQEIHGQGKREMLENLFNSNSYKQATNEQKAEMIVDLYSDYNRGQRTIKAPFGRMPSLKPRFEWKQEYEKVEQKYLE